MNSHTRVRSLIQALAAFTLMLCDTSVGYAATNSVSTSAQRPNVLFVLTDNQPASILGVYGNRDVRTPNIDRLAREGTLFRRFYAANGMCSPTRATLLTGLMPSQHGIHNWLDDSMMQDWPRDWSAIAEFRTLSLVLRNRGYRTAMIGKWHLGQPWEPSLGYQYWVTLSIGHTIDFWDNTVIDNGETVSVKGRHIVDYFTDKAVDYIEQQDGDEPFYLQLNYDGPYLNPPTNSGPARNRFYRDYLGRSFDSFPRVAFNQNLARQILEKEDHNPFIIKQIFAALAMHNDPETMANVASQNTLVDDGIGRVMAALKRKGLDTNTLVIFSSDQGNFYGQHGLWEHTVVTTPSNLYETAMNIPLIMRQPGRIEKGASFNSLLAQYDLPITILRYLGIDEVAFPNSPGKSFAGLLDRDKPLTPREEVFFEQEESRGIRTDRYALWTRLKGTGGPELYDMWEDPQQNTNLANRPEYSLLVEDLERRITAFFDHYSDPHYDLWKGGVAKGSVVRPELFKRLYGPGWETETPLLPPYKEER